MYKKLLCSVLLLLTAQLSLAQQLQVDIEIPRINVAEYHRPYVAVWIAKPNHQVVANLSVWYQLAESKDGRGEKWLKDLRQWWRRSGRTLDMPVDGMTSATKPVGTHTLSYTSNDQVLAQLATGEYVLHVEAVREVGGREHLSIPFSWVAKTRFEANKKGNSELANVLLRISPEN